MRGSPEHSALQVCAWHPALRVWHTQGVGDPAGWPPRETTTPGPSGFPVWFAMPLLTSLSLCLFHRVPFPARRAGAREGTFCPQFSGRGAIGQGSSESGRSLRPTYLATDRALPRGIRQDLCFYFPAPWGRKFGCKLVRKDRQGEVCITGPSGTEPHGTGASGHGAPVGNFSTFVSLWV